jgi:hypothetical protein
MPRRGYRYRLLGSELTASGSPCAGGGRTQGKPKTAVACSAASDPLGEAVGRETKFPPRLSDQPCLVSGTPKGSRLFVMKVVGVIAWPRGNAGVLHEKVTRNPSGDERGSDSLLATRKLQFKLTGCVGDADRVVDADDIPAVACCRSSPSSRLRTDERSSVTSSETGPPQGSRSPLRWRLVSRVLARGTPGRRTGPRRRCGFWQ